MRAKRRKVAEEDAAQDDADSGLQAYQPSGGAAPCHGVDVRDRADSQGDAVAPSAGSGILEVEGAEGAGLDAYRTLVPTGSMSDSSVTSRHCLVTTAIASAPVQVPEKMGTANPIKRPPSRSCCKDEAQGLVARAIRGRDTSLGAEMRGDPEGAIRGLDHEPGTAAERARNRAAEKLAAANAHLKRSLDDHRERVEKRKHLEASRQGGLPAQAPTATDRLKALRRRIAEREAMARQGAAGEAASTGALPDTPAVGAAARGDGGDTVGDMPCRNEVRLRATDCSAEEPSKEDVKMHLLHEGNGEANEDGGRGQAPSDNADTAAAARYEAWHSGDGRSSERRTRKSLTWV